LQKPDSANVPYDLSVLYVEDDASIRDIMTRFINRRVKELNVAENGEQALEIFARKHSDLIITDVKMPKIDGLEMIEKIRQECDRTQVILTTAFCDDKYYERAIKLGISRFLRKPIVTEELELAISSAAKASLKRKKMEERERFSDLVLEQTTSLVLIMRKGQVVFANGNFLRFAAISDIVALNAERVIDRLIVAKEGGLHKNLAFAEWIAAVLSNPDNEFVVHLRPPDGASGKEGSYVVRARKSAENTIVTFTDVTKIAKARETALKEALTDPLTKIGNRRMFDVELKREMSRFERYRRALAIIAFDIDLFKKINDELGHCAGDSVLQGIAELTRRFIRKSDIFTRNGGDEFALLLPETSLEGAVKIAKKLRETISAETFFGRKITCSFGVAGARHAEDAEGFVKRADTMLYKAKKSGRDSVESDCD
jgi:diguanylate cyclase (GGDEF)-like protein